MATEPGGSPLRPGGGYAIKSAFTYVGKGMP
jgi:hypothetical protein